MSAAAREVWEMRLWKSIRILSYIAVRVFVTLEDVLGYWKEKASAVILEKNLLHGIGVKLVAGGETEVARSVQSGLCSCQLVWRRRY